MRLQTSESKNATSFYVTKSVYNKGTRSTKIVEKLGTYEELKIKLDGRSSIGPSSGKIMEKHLSGKTWRKCFAKCIVGESGTP